MLSNHVIMAIQCSPLCLLLDVFLKLLVPRKDEFPAENFRETLARRSD